LLNNNNIKRRFKKKNLSLENYVLYCVVK